MPFDPICPKADCIDRHSCWHVGHENTGANMLKVFQCRKCGYIFRVPADKEF